MELNNIGPKESTDVLNSNAAVPNNNYLGDEELEQLTDDEDEISRNLSRATLSLAKVGDPDWQEQRQRLNNNSDRRHSQTSTSSSLLNRRTSSQEAKGFLATKDGALEVASQLCKPILFKDMDGSLLGFWLLTEISSWDVERERLIYLTEHSVLVIKFDFVNMKLLDYKRHALRSFDSIALGELKYPLGSLVPSRNQLGIRCMWNKGREIATSIKWNPFSNEVPWLTITSHPLLSNEEVENRHSYDVDHFSKALLEQIDREQLKDTCHIIHAPIIIENYFNAISAFANVSSLGFFKSRGKISF